MIIIHLDDGTTRIGNECCVTGRYHEIRVPTEGFKRWQDVGGLIQDCLPTTSAEDREFLISRVSPEGWKLLFADFKD